MRLRADVRPVVERGARLAALALLMLALWRAVVAVQGAPVRMQVRLDGAPSARERDSLGAVARSGRRLTWSGSVPALAAMAEGVRGPHPAVRISAVSDSIVVVAETFGVIDSLAAGGGTLTLATGSLDAETNDREHRLGASLLVTEGRTSARVAAAPAPVAKRVLVLGRANWESKFTIAALEEAGWAVEARVRLSDIMSVVQGARGVPTLATHAAVVVLDRVNGDEAMAIIRFVRSGGGLVLSGEGSAAALFASVAPAPAGRSLPPVSRTFEGVDALRALSLRSLGELRPDAVLLESRDGARAGAARREMSGRVVQSGFTETWRWRMEGEAGSVAAHREWWSRLVAMAVPTPSRSALAAVADEGAPLAALVHALGVPSDPQESRDRRGPALPLWLGASIVALLLGEWALRRSRGAA